MAPFAPGQATVLGNDRIAVGARSQKYLPGDDPDGQPCWLSGRTLLFTADVRIDNRDEVEAQLGISRAAGELSDAEVLAAAWERWNEVAVDRVLGDYALASWDNGSASLVLARSVFSSKPLFYCVTPGFVAFASMPHGLHALSGLPKRIDFEHMAMVAAQYSYLGQSTVFEGIKLVPHGHIIRLCQGSEQIRSFWTPERSIFRFARTDDYSDGLREELDRAVAARLRRSAGGIAAQLSAGRDSSAVAGTAARLMAGSGESLLALTGAPREGFTAPELGDRLNDEVALASATASAHANVHHLACRTRQRPILAELTDLHRLHSGPLLNPSNLPWWSQLFETAAANGATVMLNAGAGNFALSAGGVDQLRDMLVDEGALAWLRVALPMGGISPARWLNILNVSLGPSLGSSAYRRLKQATGREVDDFSVPILREPYRRSAENRMAAIAGDLRPPASFTDYRIETLRVRDNPEKMHFARWGIEQRDPTADRRLIEYCLRLPNDQLVSARSARPAFERAFGDRIPRAVITNRRRGYQCADWFEHFTRDLAASALQSYGTNHIVREVFDLDYLRGIIDKWPQSGWQQRPQIYTYRNTVLAWIALANFIAVHSPD